MPNRTKFRANVGIFLLCLGIAVPLASLLFVANWKPQRGIIANLTSTYIEISPQPKVLSIEEMNQLLQGEDLSLRLEFKWVALFGISAAAVGAFLKCTSK